MTWILIAVALYVGFGAFFYFFQHLFFFRPEVLSFDFQYKYPFPFEELHFDTPDGGRINAIYFRVPNARGVVYYLKGNSRSIKGWGKFAKDFVSNGYEFLMMDYRGFGKSRGKRTQALLFQDAQLLYDWLKRQYAEAQIVVFGRSLGSGIASWVASKNRPRLLILDSPYFSFYHNIRRYIFFLPVRWLIRYDLRTDQFLHSVECPVHIIHGKRDHLIPFHQSERLKALHPGKVHLHPVEKAHHNNLPDFPEFYELLYDILYVRPH